MLFATLAAALALHTHAPHFIHEFTLPLGVYPSSIVAGPDGALWFSTYPYFSNHAPKELGIGRITTTGATRYFHINHGTYDLTSGPDGRIWFTSPYHRPYIVGALATDGTVSAWPVPGGGSPESIISGPDGNLWFTSFYGNPDILAISTAGTIVKQYYANKGFVVRLGRGRDHVWYDMPARIGRIKTDGDETGRDIGGPTYIPELMALGPDGRMWECDGTFIVAVTVDFTVTFYPIPQGVNGTYGLTRGPDGNMWATDFYEGKLMRITPSGSFTTFDLPTPDMMPSGITVGPDGNIWYTEIQKQTDVAKIGVLAP